MGTPPPDVTRALEREFEEDEAPSCGDGEFCPTCGQRYVEDQPSVCSNPFHCCRDCKHLFGRLVLPCERHKDEGADTDGIEVCPGCDRVMDTTICWCGSPMKPHSVGGNIMLHNPCPIGCVCGYVKKVPWE